MALTGRDVLLSAVRWMQRLADVVLIVAIIAPLILFGLQFPHAQRLDGLWLIRSTHRVGDPLMVQVGSLFRIAWPPASSTSFLPLGMALATWLVKIGVDAIFLRTHRLFARLMPAPRLIAEGGAELPLGAGAVSADSERARAELLKRYREIENALKSAKRKKCAFLSIDVVGSTQMKMGQKETEVAATFQAYMEMLRKIFDEFGAWKVAWTPDGVMVCFLQLDLAVRAAQRVLESLKNFNQTENRLQSPFRVRCGLNMGEVPIFEDSRLESVADRVIDVAGHMQKHSTPNTLWLSTEISNLLVDRSGFRENGQSVDGHEVCEWSPEPSLAPADKAGA